MPTIDRASLPLCPPVLPIPSAPVVDEYYATEARYDLSNPHIIRMALYSIEIATLCGITDPFELDDVYFTAILHDMGKTVLRVEVLNKPGPLTPEERAHVETHAALGEEIVRSMPGWERISRAVRAHHEWWDGNGYPDRIAGDAIPLTARIVAVADVFDAMTSRRPYREPLSIRDAILHIAGESGTHFDPAVVKAFLKIPEEKWAQLHHQADGLTSAELLKAHTW